MGTQGALDVLPFSGKAAMGQAWGLRRGNRKSCSLQTESHDCPSSKKGWEHKLITFQLLWWRNVDFFRIKWPELELPCQRAVDFCVCRTSFGLPTW